MVWNPGISYGLFPGPAAAGNGDSGAVFRRGGGGSGLVAVALRPAGRWRSGWGW